MRRIEYELTCTKCGEVVLIITAEASAVGLVGGGVKCTPDGHLLYPRHPDETICTFHPRLP